MDETHGWERATPMALMGSFVSATSAKFPSIVGQSFTLLIGA